jgi:NADPH:quinone reductase-like Zn-dependent oxidoreductase
MNGRSMTEAGADGMMRAIRLHTAGGPEGLVLDEIEIPTLSPGDALVRVHVAAITRDELEWPEDRLPAIPAYEISGVVAAVTPEVTGVAVGDAVCALTSFERNGGAADYVAVKASILSPTPRSLDDAQSAAIPMAGLSAWQGLIEHGGLREGQRVMITGAAGGVGHIATQLARQRGAHVIGIASSESAELARGFGAHEVFDPAAMSSASIEPVDLVFDTVGGEPLARSASLVRGGGRLVSIAEEPSAHVVAAMKTTYFVVEPHAEQLAELVGLADARALRPVIDSRFPLAEARAAFERVQGPGKRGKVVLDVSDE